MMSHAKIYKLMSFAALAAGLVGCEKKAPEKLDTRPLVRVGAATSGVPFADALAVQGMVRAKNTASIAARVPGTIDEMLVEEGSVVKKGAVLFRVDRVNLANAVRAAKDDLAMAKAKLAQSEATDAKAKLDVERMARLAKEGAVTKDMFEKADVAAKSYAAALGAARATVTKAETGLAVAEKNFADSEVKAPFDGVVTKKHRNAGDFCGAGMKVFELEDTSCYEICVSLNAAQYGRVVVGKTELEVGGEKIGGESRSTADGADFQKVGQESRSTADGADFQKVGQESRSTADGAGFQKVGQESRSTADGCSSFNQTIKQSNNQTIPLTYKSPSVNPLTRTFEVRAVVKKTDALAAGMLVDCRVTFARRTAQAVPAAAVAHRGGGDCVFKVVDGRVVRVPVVAGLTANGLREIVAVGNAAPVGTAALSRPQLSPDDQLIVEGMLLVNEGDEVRIQIDNP